MDKKLMISIAWGLLFLVIIQMMGTLVESIYILDLLNTSLDEKALGLLFFFSPALLLPFRKRVPIWLTWAAFGLLFVVRGITPTLGTTGRMLASGAGTSVGLILLVILLAQVSGEGYRLGQGKTVASGMALAVGFSTLLRTVNSTVDISLTPAGGWIGWALVVLLAGGLIQMPWERQSPSREVAPRNTSAVVGIILVLTLVYFAFSAPGVIARWTGGDYTLIVSAVSLLALGYAYLATVKPGVLERVAGRTLLLWNLFFTLSLVGTILAHRVPFPFFPEHPAVVVRTAAWYQHIPLVVMLLLSPVIFIDVQRFAASIQMRGASIRSLAVGALLGALALVVLIFMNIFTNVWGYVEPVSPLFRNKFWLPFALIGGALILLATRHNWEGATPAQRKSAPLRSGWGLFLGAIFLVTAFSALPPVRVRSDAEDMKSLLVMTANIQQANNLFGQKSYQEQLELFREVTPHVLGLQESDSARISLNNNDYVRYFADKLGYYSYYGPSPVTGTFGTAILSTFPLQNPRSVFTYSERDEVGTAVAEIEVAGRRFTVYNVHPAGSERVMRVFAETILARAEEAQNVIILGDFNLREDEQAYHTIDEVYKNVWIDLYPTGVSDDGLDMSGGKRIDHIFVSPHLRVLDSAYILSPDSHTDHPVHWAEISWEE